MITKKIITKDNNKKDNNKMISYHENIISLFKDDISVLNWLNTLFTD